VGAQEGESSGLDSSGYRGFRGRGTSYDEIAISDFPRRSGPLISAEIRGARSRRVGVRHFGTLGVEGIAEDSRNPELRRVPR
jgi:hypothetical protein